MDLLIFILIVVTVISYSIYFISSKNFPLITLILIFLPSIYYTGLGEFIFRFSSNASERLGMLILYSISLAFVATNFLYNIFYKIDNKGSLSKKLSIVSCFVTYPIILMMILLYGEKLIGCHSRMGRIQCIFLLLNFMASLSYTSYRLNKELIKPFLSWLLSKDS